jgi:hypothetical protein
VAVTLTVTLSFVALVVDLGLLVLSRHSLINAVDAAALAGARELPDDPERARQVASDYAYLNGAEQVEVEISPDLRSLTVTGTRPVVYFFAPIMGLVGGEARAQATAVVGGITGVRGAAPLAAPSRDYEVGSKYLLKLAAGQDSPLGPGTFSALSLGGYGAKVYEENLKHGFDGWLRVGDVVPTETGNMSNPTKRAIDYRLSCCPHSPPCTPQSYEPDCPRILILPVYDSSDLAGGQVKSIRVVGFAAFLVEQVCGQGNENYLEGYFVRHVVPGESDPSQYSYGLQGVKLVR